MFGISNLKDRLFVRYAQAMSAAQTLELALTSTDLQVTILSDMRQGKFSKVQRLMEGRQSQKRTMGHVARRLSDSATTEGIQDAQQFYRAVKALIQRRNLLAHKFFVENEDKLTSKQGLREAIRELESFRIDCLVMTQVLLQSQNTSLLLVAETFLEAQRAQEQQELELWQSLSERLRTTGNVESDNK